MPIDASQLIWVATANDERGIPEPILNRMNVYEVRAPDQSRCAASRIKLYAGLRAEHDWGRASSPSRAEVLERLAEMALREMLRLDDRFRQRCWPGA